VCNHHVVTLAPMTVEPADEEGRDGQQRHPLGSVDRVTVGGEHDVDVSLRVAFRVTGTT